MPLLQEGLELPILLTLSKLQPFLLKQRLKTQKKLKELEIMYVKMQSISAFLDITKVAGFR